MPVKNTIMQATTIIFLIVSVCELFLTCLFYVATTNMYPQKEAITRLFCRTTELILNQRFYVHYC